MKINRILEIAVPCPLRRSFDYLPPADCPALLPGMRVLVPFGNRRVVGVLLASKDASTVDPSKLKPAQAILDSEPSLAPPILALCLWAARYYQHPVGDCLQQALPPRLRSAKVPREEPAQAWLITEVGRQCDPQTLKRAPRQLQLLALLQRDGQIGREHLRESGFNRGHINALCERGLAAALITPFPLPETASAGNKALCLNDEQQQAMDTVSASLGKFGGFLLEGVTGSGKTEVYLQLIERCLANGHQALVLIPEIGLTPQTLARFQNRFGNAIAVLHSAMSEGDRLRAWQAAREGRCRIVLGTRSAIFAPLPELGLIIVDEEHDLSYKQQDGFRYSARDLAVKRAADSHCPVLLGTATPSLESLHNANQGRYRHLHLTQRAGDAAAPALRLLDIRQQPLQHGLSEAALERIDSTLRAGNQALVFLNRRGFSPALQCHSCGWVADCQHCDARMTVHYGRRQLRCHHCEAVQALPDNCPRCGNNSLLFKGPGTERLELALRQHVGDFPVIRIDRDTTANRFAMHDLVATVHEGEPCVLVGTQMLAKGHHFPDVTTVVIVDIDGGLFSADYRGPERTGQLLIQVAGRAGRAEKPGEVLIQTHCPDHPVLERLVKHGYSAFAKGLLEERALLQLPPFGFSALVRADAGRPESAEQFLRELRSLLPAPTNHWQMIGPLPAPMTRKAGRFRAVMILQASERGRLHSALQTLCAGAESLRGRDGLRWSLDVDPVDMY